MVFDNTSIILLITYKEMKKCLHCKKNVKAKALECPYCGRKNFSFSNEDTKPSTTEQSYELNNQGISVDFEKLINHALSDGELSDKEKQVIFKRAQKEGVDLDELELILEAKLKTIIGQQQKNTYHYS